MPKVVTGLAAFLAAIYLVQKLIGGAANENLVFSLGVTPELFQMRPWPENFLALLGHMFLHGHIVHLAFNAMFLLQIGEPLAFRLSEARGERGGALRFFGLFVLTGLAGGVLYFLLEPHSPQPMIGASGGASGLFGAYLVAARPTWRESLADPLVRRSAFWFLLVNVGLAAFARVAGVLPIAWEAHLGGFLAGLVLYPLIAGAPARPV
jgi:membrane associated rhomboid family serine protease